ncbi:MAG TPA: hypothetical protein VFB06_03215 [Streptosporangiaceae bacterium]|nr:hypothetical protein [Streptosporangiaceae bacterium]
MSPVLASHWRREVLRTGLWFVPAVEVIAAIGLFTLTTLLDKAPGGPAAPTRCTLSPRIRRAARCCWQHRSRYRPAGSWRSPTAGQLREALSGTR